MLCCGEKGRRGETDLSKAEVRTNDLLFPFPPKSCVFPAKCSAFGAGGISSCFRRLSIWASLDSWVGKPGSCGLISVIRLTFGDVLSKCGVCCYFRWISKQCVHLIFISEISGISNKGVNVVGRCTGRLLQSCVAQKVRTFPHSL